MFNITFCVLVCIPLLFLLRSNENIESKFVIISISIFWSCTISTILILIHRTYYIFQPPNSSFYDITTQVDVYESNQTISHSISKSNSESHSIENINFDNQLRLSVQQNSQIEHIPHRIDKQNVQK
jgi:hypothetical protein